MFKQSSQPEPFEFIFDETVDAGKYITYPVFVTDRLNFFTEVQRKEILSLEDVDTNNQRDIYITLCGSHNSRTVDLQ